MFQWLKKLFGGDDASKPAPKKRGRLALTSLQINDIVVHLDQTYQVQQRIVNHDDGFFWYDYRLTGAERVLWLSVEEDDELIAALYEPAQLDWGSGDPPKTLTHDGAAFTRQESGKADATITRASGSETRTTVRRWDYAADDDPKRMLSIQRWGEDETEVMVGRAVSPHVLELLPGDDIDGGEL